MMSYALPELAGSVSAARSGIGQAFYALGPDSLCACNYEHLRHSGQRQAG